VRSATDGIDLIASVQPRTVVQASDESARHIPKEPGDQRNYQKGAEYGPEVHIPSFAERAVVRVQTSIVSIDTNPGPPHKTGKMLTAPTIVRLFKIAHFLVWTLGSVTGCCEAGLLRICAVAEREGGN
jgi:hypothetical protein